MARNSLVVGAFIVAAVIVLAVVAVITVVIEDFVNPPDHDGIGRRGAMLRPIRSSCPVPA
jgi:hypothetical protein